MRNTSIATARVAIVHGRRSHSHTMGMRYDGIAAWVSLHASVNVGSTRTNLWNPMTCHAGCCWRVTPSVFSRAANELS